MMNILALCLVATSLATAGVWSPTPAKQNTRDDIIVIEGHRVVVVEYEKEGDGNTKVSISRQDRHASHKPPEVEDKSYISAAEEKLLEAAMMTKEKIKEASSVIPNIGEGLLGSHPSPNGYKQSPKELVCEVFGQCNHKIASAIGKAKEKVSEKGHEVEEEAKVPKEAVREELGKAKEIVSHKAHKVSDKAREVEEGVKEAAAEALGKAKDTVSQKAHEVKEGAKEATRKAKHGVEIVVDKANIAVEDIEGNISTKMETAKAEAKDKAKQVLEMVEHTADIVEGQNDFNDIFRRGREVAYDVVTSVGSPVTTDSLVGVVHLMGFSTAYGMCIWVTFISSYVLAGALPRQQFGMVQSKIYPVYFRAMTYCVGLALLAHLLSQRKRWFSNKADTFQGYNLLASLLMLLANLLYLEPRATKVPQKYAFGYINGI